MSRFPIISILVICVMISSGIASPARPPRRCFRFYFSKYEIYSACRGRRSVESEAAFARGRRSVEDTCILSMEKAGLNISAFSKDVAHGIHSITVEDIKYYFEPSIPNENNIPTVNPSLSGQHIFLSAPFGSEFNTPGMRLMDYILSNDDGTDNFMVRGASRMEKIAHGMHMLELWHKTSGVYKEMKANPPNDKVCSCVTDDDANGILDTLKVVSVYMRITGEEEKSRSIQLEQDILSNEVDGDAGIDSENVDVEEEMPKLEDAESWKVWKEMLKFSMLDDNGINHLAMYLYCKIAAVAGN